MTWAVARCGECGAALRLDARATQATCVYCGVTSYSNHASPNAPRIIIAAPPHVKDHTISNVVMGTISLAVTMLGLYAAVAINRGGWLFVAIGGGLLAACVGGYARNRRAIAEETLMRSQGIPGRATIRALGAGHGHSATLSLEVEAGGQVRSLSLPVTIPALLVPRVSTGVTLPVLVHPRHHQQVQIQWHLL